MRIIWGLLLLRLLFHRINEATPHSLSSRCTHAWQAPRWRCNFPPESWRHWTLSRRQDANKVPGRVKTVSCQFQNVCLNAKDLYLKNIKLKPLKSVCWWGMGSRPSTLICSCSRILGMLSWECYTWGPSIGVVFLSNRSELIAALYWWFFPNECFFDEHDVLIHKAECLPQNMKTHDSLVGPND